MRASRPGPAVLLLLFLTLGSGVPAGLAAGVSFDAALARLQAGELEMGRALMRDLAQAGDPRAQDVLAAMMLKGVGGARDRRGAMGWYCRLAHHPDGGRETVNALWRLAEYFRTGGGQPGSGYLEGERALEDPVKALFWFEILAQQERFYGHTLPEGARLGRIGAGRVRGLLLPGEREAVIERVERWRPQPPGDGEACLALP